MDMSYVVNGVQGKTLTDELLPLTIEKDANDKGVLRVVDAAPFAYDLASDSLKTKDDLLLAKITELITVVNNTSNSNYTGLDILQMPLVSACKNISELKYLYPLQEINSVIPKDFSTNDYSTGLKTNILAVNSNITTSLRRFANFTTTNSFIKIPKECSIKGLTTFTWFGAVEVKGDGVARKLYNESALDYATPRLQISITASRTLAVYVRSGTVAVEPLTCIGTTPLSVGMHMIFISVDVVADNIAIYVDTAVSAPKTLTNSLSESAIANDVPGGEIYIGASCLTTTTPTTPTYTGNMAYVGLYTRSLTLAEIQTILTAGGF